MKLQLTILTTISILLGVLLGHMGTKCHHEEQINALQIECQALAGYKAIVQEYYDSTRLHEHCFKISEQ